MSAEQLRTCVRDRFTFTVPRIENEEKSCICSAIAKSKRVEKLSCGGVLGTSIQMLFLGYVPWRKRGRIRLGGVAENQEQPVQQANKPHVDVH